MRTLEQAIQARIVERERMEREAAEREQQNKALREERERQAEEGFRAWLSECIDADVSSLNINVIEDFDGMFIAEVLEGTLSIQCRNRFVSTPDEGFIPFNPRENLTEIWRVTQLGSGTSVNAEHFIDAFIYARDAQ